MKKAEIQELENLIITYGENKGQLDALKKACDEDNGKIKFLMSHNNLDTYESGAFKASYSVQHREAPLDECDENLIKLLKKAKVKDLIKTKEYIDMDALESALYNEQIPKKIVLEMDKFRSVKEVQVLKVTKRKESK